MCGALSCGQHRMDRVQELVMAERLGDKGGDEAGAQGVLHEAIRWHLRLFVDHFVVGILGTGETPSVRDLVQQRTIRATHHTGARTPYGVVCGRG